MEQEPIKHFSQLRVWQDAHKHVLLTYQLTSQFPKEEMFGLISQMRRAAVSSTSNLAEGFGRRSAMEKQRFYNIAYASVLELENQWFVARDLGYVLAEKVQSALQQNVAVQRQLNALMRQNISPTSNS